MRAAAHAAVLFNTPSVSEGSFSLTKQATKAKSSPFVVQPNWFNPQPQRALSVPQQPKDQKGTLREHRAIVLVLHATSYLILSYLILKLIKIPQFLEGIRRLLRLGSTYFR